MFVEVDGNPNCERSVFARFKEVGPARRVVQVRCFDRDSRGEWCWVTGWCDDPTEPTCPAYAQVVEDSGAGLAHLVSGGNWGLRLKPVALDERWDLDSRSQWGEPYLSLAEAADLRFAEE